MITLLHLSELPESVDPNVDVASPGGLFMAADAAGGYDDTLRQNRDSPTRPVIRLGGGPTAVRRADRPVVVRQPSAPQRSA